MKRKLIIGFTTLFALCARGAPTAPAPLEINLAESAKKVEFLAIGKPSQIKIAGKIDGEKPQATGLLKVDGKNIRGKAIVNLDHFKTGIELRDEHMKTKYLHTDKFPTSEFEFTELTLPSDLSTKEFEGKDLPVEGKMKLHGVEKIVKGVAQFKKTENTIDMNLQLTFNLSDFGIETPGYLGIKVSEAVTVTVVVLSSLQKNA